MASRQVSNSSSNFSLSSRLSSRRSSRLNSRRSRLSRLNMLNNRGIMDRQASIPRSVHQHNLRICTNRVPPHSRSMAGQEAAHRNPLKLLSRHPLNHHNRRDCPKARELLIPHRSNCHNLNSRVNRARLARSRSRSLLRVPRAISRVLRISR